MKKEYFTNWITKDYLKFNGRTSRGEYLCVFITYILIIITGLIILGNISKNMQLIGIGIMQSYLLITIIPFIGITVRRLHDTGISGWNLLLNLIPFIGGLIVTILSIKKADPKDNKYGKSL